MIGLLIRRYLLPILWALSASGFANLGCHLAAVLSRYPFFLASSVSKAAAQLCISGKWLERQIRAKELTIFVDLHRTCRGSVGSGRRWWPRACSCLSLLSCDSDCDLDPLWSPKDTRKSRTSSSLKEGRRDLASSGLPKDRRELN